MSFFHWSRKQLNGLNECEFIQKIGPKPCGIWFDVNGDWKRWCVAENFDMGRLSFRHRIEIVNPYGVLFLRNAADIDDFTGSYLVFDRSYDRTWNIDWPLVARNHHGIVIAPYCWERRMELMWYYGWDCASGCVWDLGAIKIHVGRKISDRTGKTA